MKKIIAGIFAFFLGIASSFGQTFPVNNLTVAGTAAFTGLATFTLPPVGPTSAVGTNTTGMATTAFVANHSPCPSILDNGGNNTNSADNTAAFAATAAVGPVGHACVYFPPGVYSFSSNVSYTFPNSTGSISIRGAGADVSILTWPNASGGMTLNYQGPGTSSHIRDLTMTTGQINGGTAISLTQTTGLAAFEQSDIHDVTFRGADNLGNLGNDYWTNALFDNGVSGLSIDSVTVWGTSSGLTALGNGLIFQGPGGDSGWAIYLNVSKCTFTNLNLGISYGNQAQGLTVTQTNFQNGNTGILVPSSTSGQAQLQISDSQFANSGNEIAVFSAVSNIQIHDNDMYCHVGNACIAFFNTAAAGYSIVGNNLNADGSGAATGISIGTPSVSTAAGVITGNEFNGLNVAINLQATSRNNNVQSNAYSNNTTNVINSGTNNTVGGGSQ